jgi:hypothetical protein
MTEDTTPTAARTPARTIDLSFPQLIGGSVAAATAAALSTRLGVVGTIVGAGFASLVSAVVAATLAAWLRRAGDLTVRREPTRLRSLAVGAAAVALVAVAFNAGVDLLLSDLPSDTFASRFLAELGLDGA